MHPKSHGLRRAYKRVIVLHGVSGVIASTVLATVAIDALSVVFTFMTGAAGSTGVEWGLVPVPDGTWLAAVNPPESVTSHSITINEFDGLPLDTAVVYFRVASNPGGTTIYSAVYSFSTLVATLTAGSMATITSVGGIPTVTTDTGDGTLYYAVMTSGGSATDAQIIAGSGGNIVAGKAGSQAVTLTGVQTFPAVTGLTASTNYTLVMMQVASPAGRHSAQTIVNFATIAGDKQFMVPGVGYIHETTDYNFMVPGGGYIQENI